TPIHSLRVASASLPCACLAPMPVVRLRDNAVGLSTEIELDETNSQNAITITMARHFERNSLKLDFADDSWRPKLQENSPAGRDAQGECRRKLLEGPEFTQLGVIRRIRFKHAEICFSEYKVNECAHVVFERIEIEGRHLIYLHESRPR